MSDDREGTGRRLRHYVDERMAAAGVRSYSALAGTADVSRDTLNRWFGGDRVSPKAGAAVAAVLGVTYRDLLDAREGLPPRPSDELEAMLDRAAERAVRLVLAELRAGEGRDG